MKKPMNIIFDTNDITVYEYCKLESIIIPQVIDGFKNNLLSKENENKLAMIFENYKLTYEQAVAFVEIYRDIEKEILKMEKENKNKLENYIGIEEYLTLEKEAVPIIIENLGTDILKDDDKKELAKAFAVYNLNEEQARILLKVYNNIKNRNEIVSTDIIDNEDLPKQENISSEGLDLKGYLNNKELENDPLYNEALDKFEFTVNNLCKKDRDILGITSDAINCDEYHTMDELYEHRTILFAIICSLDGRAWKSRKHSDGTSEDGWFIAGLNLPEGQVTYHQKMSYWSMFKCKILEEAPEYDGHTSNDVINRLVYTFL